MRGRGKTIRTLSGTGDECKRQHEVKVSRVGSRRSEKQFLQHAFCGIISTVFAESLCEDVVMVLDILFLVLMAFSHPCRCTGDMPILFSRRGIFCSFR